MAAFTEVPPTNEERIAAFPQEEEEEEEEEVKSKPKGKPLSSFTSQGQEEEEDIPSLEDHIDSRPPSLPSNSDRSSTINRPLLEIADTRREDSTSLQLMWEGKGELGLSGKFKVQGKTCTMRLEDDALHWTWTGKGNYWLLREIIDY